MYFFKFDANFAEICFSRSSSEHASIDSGHSLAANRGYAISRINDDHWNENVVILMKFSSLAALEVVILTTFSAASDENFIKMKTFPFQWPSSVAYMCAGLILGLRPANERRGYLVTTSLIGWAQA